MTELDLYKFIHYNNVEVHIYRNGASVENCNGFEEDNMDEWRIIMFPQISILQDFINILSLNMLTNGGIKATLKKTYAAIELLEIMNYYNIDPKSVFK